MTFRTTGLALILAGLSVPAVSAFAQTAPAVPPAAPAETPALEGPMLRMFERLDLDKDGRVTKEEIATFRAQTVQGLDANGDGYLSKEEVVAFRLAQEKERIEREVDRLFEGRDLNTDGRLGADELLAGPGGIVGHPGGAHFGGRMFDRIDRDGDGVITTEEAAAAQADFRGHMQKRMDRDHGPRDHDRGDRGPRGEGPWRDGPRGDGPQGDGPRHGPRPGNAPDRG